MIVAVHVAKKRRLRRYFLKVGGCACVSMTTLRILLERNSGGSAAHLPNDMLARDATGERIALGPARNFLPYESRAADRAGASTWVQIDLGSAQPIDAVILYPSNKYFMAYTDSGRLI